MFDLLSIIADLFKIKTAQNLPPEKIFERFRHVLRSNNQALEIIADMGEKLSGDFIFDQHYIETSFSNLKTAVYKSLQGLNTLAPGHEELYPVYERLTGYLAKIMTGDEDRHGPLIIHFKSVSPLQFGIVGGKNAHLAELIQNLELPVPPGFCITTRTYHELLAANHLLGLVEQFEELYLNDGSDENLDKYCQRLSKAIVQAEAPDDFLEQLDSGLQELAADHPAPFSLAVRSSAQEEDLDFSFAGQFHSELNVKPDASAVFQAYLKVVASLYSSKAMAYRRRLFPDDAGMSIACGCQLMIDSKVSGVAYSTDPANPGGNTMVVAGSWGQGASVVEGKTPVDIFHLDHSPPFAVQRQEIACKESELYLGKNAGLRQRPLTAARQNQACLNNSQLQKLAAGARQLANYFKRPQDIEWCFDREDRLYILQSRPLLVPATNSMSKNLEAGLAAHELLIKDQGMVAQLGIGAGPVYIVHSSKDLENFPDGAILVSRRDSSRFVRVMRRAAAIITEIGTPVSHMSTLCRELQVPCLVNVPGIIKRLTNGMEITVDAEDRCIYKGRVKELLAYQLSTPTNLTMSREFRLLRRLLNNVSRLHLVDPLLDKFTPANCRTYHDLLRYIHESAVISLVNMGKNEKNLLRQSLARHLDLPIPAGIMVIDIGGGLAPQAPKGMVAFQDIASIPFRAILQGMLYPDVWHRTTMPVGLRDLMSSMLSAPPDALNGQYSGHNVAVISKNYVNLCFRFGYHFNIIDAHCDKIERENHIYFRFLGGATDICKRSRRARLIAEILLAFDFNVKTRGDLVIARASNMVQSEMERSLDILGRLVGFTRQLDVCLNNDAIVDRYAEAFLQGIYDITAVS